MVLIQALTSAALTVLTPFLPLYLVELGITDPARLSMWSGAINSINFLIVAAASPLWGALADRVGRRAMVLRSSMAICLFTALMGLSTEAWHLFALRALIGRLVPAARRGRACEITASATFLGPFSGGAVAAAFGIRYVFVGRPRCCW